MDIHTNIPLKKYTTMQLGGEARFMANVHSLTDVASICKSAHDQNLPIYVLGGGSNTLVHDEGFDGVVVHNLIEGFNIVNDTENNTTIKVGAGENWDSFVKRAVDMNLTGVEALSAIPGTVGAAPVQNIGAYGQEVAETIVSLEAYDTTNGVLVTLTNEQCQFSYRNSIFRDTEMGRYIIISVNFCLYKGMTQPPFYLALQNYFDALGTTFYTPQVIRDAVIAIRADKLPDPRQRPNSGSFFKNAFIETWQLDELRAEYPDIPSYSMADGRHKIPTGWLIERAGLKGQTLHGIKIHDKNALVLINESATSYADLAAARDDIIGTIRDTFHIEIKQEPLEMNSTYREPRRHLD